jgi:hypothetical protein
MSRPIEELTTVSAALRRELSSETAKTSPVMHSDLLPLVEVCEALAAAILRAEHVLTSLERRIVALEELEELGFETVPDAEVEAGADPAGPAPGGRGE